MPNQPSRASAKKKNDFDLTPPEEIRARRIRLFVLVGTLIVGAVGMGIYFAAPWIGGEIKAWQSRRVARQAFALIEQKKWSDANAKARDALLLRPGEPEAWRAIARLASRTGQWAFALEWWKKVDEAYRLTVEDRRDFVAAALTTGELSVATKQVEALLAQRTGPEPHDIVLAGQVAIRRSDPTLAIDYAERVLADKRTKPYDILSAATLVLSATTRDSQRYADAWNRIEDVARDPKNPASLDALALLAKEQALPPTPAVGADASLSLESPRTPSPAPATQGATVSSSVATSAEAASPTQGSLSQSTPEAQSGNALTVTLAATPPSAPARRTMTEIEVANALENHPDARAFHKLLALDLRARHDPILIDQYVADAMDRFRNGDDETLLALTGWLNSIGRFAKSLEVLPQDRALQGQSLFLQYVNTLIALQRWSDIKDLLTSEHSVMDPVFQHMYLAVVQAHLGSATAATNEWKRALQSANTPGKLEALAGYAEQNGANDIADAAYLEAIRIDPKNRAAYAGRVRLALASGQTAQAQTITAEIAQLWPDDAAARNQDAYLRLLLGATDGAAEAAQRQAQVLVAQEPSNWSARATLGLARLRLGKKKEALVAISEPRVTGSEPPGALAVRAAILAANGYTDPARNDALLVNANPLLPEERALIAPLLQ